MPVLPVTFVCCMRDAFHDPAAAAARFEAWWRGGRLDRPPVSLAVGRPVARTATGSGHVSPRLFWFDTAFQVDRAINALERTIFVGDASPAWTPPVGPDLLAALFGGELDFGEETVRLVARHETDGARCDWDAFARRAPDFTRDWWRTTEEIVAMAAERFAGRWHVAPPELRGNFDVLAAHYGPASVRDGLESEPAAVQRAARHVARVFAEAQLRLGERLRGLGQKTLPWFSADGRIRGGTVGCRSLALVPPEEARRWIVPVLAFEVAARERTVFAFDGAAALAHLDLVLGLPGLRAVRFAPQPIDAAAAGWMEVFRRVRAAGRSVHVVARDGPDALAVLDEIGAEGLWLEVRRPFLNIDRAAEFLASVHALAR